jgi:hypothetical protein
VVVQLHQLAVGADRVDALGPQFGVPLARQPQVDRFSDGLDVHRVPVVGERLDGGFAGVGEADALGVAQSLEGFEGVVDDRAVGGGRELAARLPLPAVHVRLGTADPAGEV